MNNTTINDFIKKHTTPVFDLQLEMEKYAYENHVPIISRDSLDILLSLIMMNQPKKVLEFGTAIAYSTIAMATNMPDDGQIITLERDLRRFEEATINIKKTLLDHKIKPYLIDATEAGEIIANHAPYDFVFIDAAKAQYQKFFDMVFPYLSDGGIILSDNIFHKGIVFQEDISKVDKRQRTIYRRMREYIKFLKSNNEQFFSAMLPIGDGLAITSKRKDNL